MRLGSDGWRLLLRCGHEVTLVEWPMSYDEAALLIGKPWRCARRGCLRFRTGQDPRQWRTVQRVSAWTP